MDAAHNTSSRDPRLRSLVDGSDMTSSSLDERPPAPPEPVVGGKRALLLTGSVWLLLAPALWLALVDPRWGTRSWDDLTQATMAALILQTATLSLALGLPLLFGDLDLSAGAVAIGGAVLAVSQATGSLP